jgi:tRNA-Thr(GGU) m(6)t(6)A37 methyltransferase TsaA
MISPHEQIAGMPIQTANARGIRGEIHLLEQYKEGLIDLSGFSHLILLYHFHRVTKSILKPVPYLDDTSHGVFATRAPCRINPIGISIVKLISVNDLIITLEDVDILNGTPIIDIKPYIPQFDSIPDATIGWYEKRLKDLKSTRADSRFEKFKD